MDIESVIVIGGNGSQQGAHALASGLRVAGIASTIDNDLTGSDVTIGVDTALNIALEAIDRLRVTHHRITVACWWKSWAGDVDTLHSWRALPEARKRL
jgi:6-phosphofructokinase